MDKWLLENPLGGALLGIGAIAAAWKVLWPLLSGFVNNATTSSRTESKTLEQLSEVLEAAIKRADDERKLRIEAEKERDAMVTRLASLEAKVEILQAKLDAYQKTETQQDYRKDLAKGA